MCGKAAVLWGGLVVLFRHRGSPESILEVHNMEIERNDFASKGVAGTGLGLGAAALGLAVAQSGVLGNILNPGAAAAQSGDNATVNRYELSMVRELTNKDMEIAYLKGRDAAKSDTIELYRYIDGKFAAVERELCDQKVFNATQISTISCVQGQIAQLMGLTKLVIGNNSVCPGWGDVTVSVTPTTTG